MPKINESKKEGFRVIPIVNGIMEETVWLDDYDSAAQYANALMLFLSAMVDFGVTTGQELLSAPASFRKRYLESLASQSEARLVSRDRSPYDGRVRSIIGGVEISVHLMPDSEATDRNLNTDSPEILISYLSIKDAIRSELLAVLNA